MDTVNVHMTTPQKRVVTKVIDTLERDGVVLIPGDTSYLLAVRIGSKKALEKLDRIKKNKKRKFYSIMLRDFTDISDYADITNQHFKFIKRVLPGPFTFILRATKSVPRVMLQSRKEVGIRIPESPFLEALLDEYRAPIVVSTAREEGSDEFLTDPEDETSHWMGAVDLLVSGGYVPSELTTVVQLEDDEFSVIREGKGNPALL